MPSAKPRQHAPRRQLEPQIGTYSTRFITDLPYEALLKEATQFQENTIVILSIFLTDRDGGSHTTAYVAAQFAVRFLLFEWEALWPKR